MGDERAASPDLGPKILVVLDGARLLRRIPGMPQVLAAARRAGVYSICIDESERLLPGGVRGGRVLGPPSPGLRERCAAAGSTCSAAVLADQVSPAWADRMARALAPVRDVSRDDADAAIPSAARLLDLIGMPDPDAGRHRRRAGTGSARTTAAPIGVGADGPFVVDLRADGPHGLIAGTTGAGKSELLQTIIASLAVANRPDAMTFVLIDYKGGSAFKDCARLPHTVGMVSDLDGHLTERALASLSAELKRREEILLHAGAKDIEDYWDTTAPAARAGRRSPRLVLIIDEFASLVAELPDFVTGLVGIAQRGRSLGVHLILATQRPAGVVSADIRANTNLRIALRVTDADESSDVIDAPDAAFIAKSTPGRCYVRSGAAAPVAVQSARIGGRRPGAGPGQPRWPGSSRCRGRRWAGRCRPTARRAAGATTTWPPTCRCWWTRSRGAARQAGRARAAQPVAGAAARGRSPLDELPPWPQARPGEVPPIPYGLTDIPASQARDAADPGPGPAAGTWSSRARRAPAGPPCCAPSPARWPRHASPGRRAHLRARLRHGRAAAAEPRCRTAARS